MEGPRASGEAGGLRCRVGGKSWRWGRNQKIEPVYSHEFLELEAVDRLGRRSSDGAVVFGGDLYACGAGTLCSIAANSFFRGCGARGTPDV